MPRSLRNGCRPVTLAGIPVKAEVQADDAPFLGGRPQIMQAQSVLALRLVTSSSQTAGSKHPASPPASLAGVLAVIERGGNPQLRIRAPRNVGVRRNHPPLGSISIGSGMLPGLPRGDGPLASASALFFSRDEAISRRHRGPFAGRDIAEIVDFGKPENAAPRSMPGSRANQGKDSEHIGRAFERYPSRCAECGLFQGSLAAAVRPSGTKPEPFHFVGGQTPPISRYAFAGRAFPLSARRAFPCR